MTIKPIKGQLPAEGTLMTDWARELESAIFAAEEAGGLIMDHYGRLAAAESAPADISTQTDRDSQEVIIARLRSAFPDDGICAEETTASKEHAPAKRRRIWVIDPIDGTRGFAVKNGEFAVMIGLAVDGVPVVGVVFEPAIDRMTYASRGGGCFTSRLGGDPIVCRTTQAKELRACIASISRSNNADAVRRFQHSLGVGRTTATYSAGIKLAQVARGETDFYLGDYLGLKDWDVCAGHVLATEAGGRVTNVDGKEIRYDGSGQSLNRRGILASNGHCHDEVLELLASGRFMPD